MSENKTSGFCPKCGASRVGDLRFCSACGVDLSVPTQITAAAENAIAADSANASSTAPVQGIYVSEREKVPTEQNSVEERERAVPKDKSTPKFNTGAEKNAKIESFSSVRSVETVSTGVGRSGNLAVRIIMLLASVIMLALSFCPFAYTETKLTSDLTCRIGYTPLDSINLTVASFHSYDNGDIQDTELYEQISDFDIYVYGDSLDASEKREAAQSLKKALVLSMLSENSPVKATFVFTALLSVFYIVVALVFFVSSLIAFISELIDRKKGVTPGRRAHKISASMLWLLLSVLPVMAYAFIQFFSFDRGGMLSKFSCEGVGVFWGLLASAAVALAATLAVSVNYSILRKRRKEYQSADGIGAHAMCLVFTVLLIASVFLPFASVTTYEIGTDSEVKAYVSVADVSEMSSDAVERYADISSKEAYPYLVYAIADLHSDEELPYGFEAELFNVAVFSYGRTDLSVLYVFIFIVTLTTLILAAFLICAVLKRALLGADNRGGLKALKILIAIFATVDFGLLYIVNKIAEATFEDGLASIMKLDIGIGMLLLLLSAIFVIATVGGVKQENHTPDFDNADVSYAPYVVGYKKYGKF